MKRITLIMCMTLVTAWGCKKDSDKPTENCRIATVTDEDQRTTTYEYDAQGRITKASYSNGYYDLLDYQPNKLLYRRYNVADQLLTDPRNEYLLNDMGYIVKQVTYAHSGATTARRREYAYSPDGFLIEYKEFYEDGHLDFARTYTIENGNRVKAQDSDVMTYTYLSDENKMGLRQDAYAVDTDPLERFLGKPNINLVNTITLGSEAVKYQYQIENGRPVNTKAVLGNGSMLYEGRYTYDCK